MTDKKPINLKIVSNGTGYDTHIIDEETGREISNVVEISWHLKGGDGKATASITCEFLGVELRGELHTMGTKCVFCHQELSCSCRTEPVTATPS